MGLLSMIPGLADVENQVKRQVGVFVGLPANYSESRSLIVRLTAQAQKENDAGKVSRLAQLEKGFSILQGDYPSVEADVNVLLDRIKAGTVSSHIGPSVSTASRMAAQIAGYNALKKQLDAFGPTPDSFLSWLPLIGATLVGFWFLVRKR